MSKEKFTKGPWAVTKNCAGSWEVQFDCGAFRGDEYLCISPTSLKSDLECCSGGETALANANLIAAAPEMYDVIVAMLEQFDTEEICHHEWDYIVIREAKKVLAKARGEKS